MVALAAFALEKFGRVDILVNNAGIAWPNPVDELDLTNWNTTIAVRTHTHTHTHTPHHARLVKTPSVGCFSAQGALSTAP